MNKHSWGAALMAAVLLHMVLERKAIGIFCGSEIVY